jgi:chromosome segregation ATPase
MSDELTQIRAHLAHHETRLDELEAAAANEAGSRALIDHDLGTVKTKLDANTRLLQAVAATQGEHSRVLTRLEDKVARTGYKVDGLTTRVDGLTTRVDGLTTGVAEVAAGQQIIIEKLDLALRPRWAFWRRAA